MAPAVELTEASTVQMRRLTGHWEGDEYIVGADGDFVALPGIGGHAVELLQASPGTSLANAAASLAAQHGVAIDMVAFLRDLVELGFVAQVDGQSVAPDAAPAATIPALRPQHVSWLFSSPARVVHALVVAAAVLSLAVHPQLIPRYSDFFWSQVISLVIAVNAALLLGNLALHEFFHLAAARSLGVPARITLGTRLKYLVVQTDVTGLWALPRERRYRVYLAGVYWDSLVAAAAVLLLAYARLPAPGPGLLRALVLLESLAVLWQFQVYMRTDIYFVLLDLLRCRNLFDDATRLIRFHRDRLRECLPPRRTAVGRHPLAGFTQSEGRKVTAYAVFMAAGSVVALATFAVYELPIIVRVLAEAAASLYHGLTGAGPLAVLDGVTTLTVEGAFQVLFIRMLLRKHPLTRFCWWRTARRQAAG